MEWASLAPALGAAITVIGAAIVKWLDGKTKALQAQLKNESDLLQTVIGRTHALEMQLAATLRKEGQLQEKIESLERQLRDRETALRELQWRYEALKENYRELEEKYKVLKLLKEYLHSIPPPAPVPREYRSPTKK